MKYSTKLSNSVHILVIIALNETDGITSSDIAESVKTNPAYVRKIMSELKAGNIIETSKGKANPTLTRGLNEITLLDIYRAVEGTKPLLHLNTNVNPECNIGVNIQYALQDYYDQIQKTVENEMRSITLKNIIENYNQRINSNEKKSSLK